MGFGGGSAGLAGSPPPIVYYDRDIVRQTYGAAASQVHALSGALNLDTTMEAIVLEVDWLSNAALNSVLQLRVDALVTLYDSARTNQSAAVPIPVYTGGVAQTQITLTDLVGLGYYSKVWIKLYKYGQHLYIDWSYWLGNDPFGTGKALRYNTGADTITNVTFLATNAWQTLRVGTYIIRV